MNFTWVNFHSNANKFRKKFKFQNNCALNLSEIMQQKKKKKAFYSDVKSNILIFDSEPSLVIDALKNLNNYCLNKEMKALGGKWVNVWLNEILREIGCDISEIIKFITKKEEASTHSTFTYC